MTFSDASGGVASFTSFSTITKVTQMVDNHGKIFAFTLRGQNAKVDKAKIEAIAIEPDSFLNGQVIENETKQRLALVRGQPYLVNLTATLFKTDETNDSESFDETGLVTAVQWNNQNGFNNQSFSFTFHVCSKIHANNALTTVELEAT